MNTRERESSLGELILAPRDVMRAENAPLLLMQPARRRKSSVVVRYTRIERWDVVEDSRTVWKRRGQLGLATVAGVGVGMAMMLGVTGRSGALVAPDGASATLALGAPATEAAPLVATAAAASPVRLVARPAPVRPIAVAPLAAATVIATPATAVERSGPDSESAALAQAFSSNESVSWRGAATTGTVVVGAATIENGKYCRDVAILTRSENAADRTMNARKCLEPGGRIADQAPPTPQ